MSSRFGSEIHLFYRIKSGRTHLGLSADASLYRLWFSLPHSLSDRDAAEHKKIFILEHLFIYGQNMGNKLAPSSYQSKFIITLNKLKQSKGDVVFLYALYGVFFFLFTKNVISVLFPVDTYMALYARTLRSAQNPYSGCCRRSQLVIVGHHRPPPRPRGFTGPGKLDKAGFKVKIKQKNLPGRNPALTRRKNKKSHSLL